MRNMLIFIFERQKHITGPYSAWVKTPGEITHVHKNTTIFWIHLSYSAFITFLRSPIE